MLLSLQKLGPKGWVDSEVSRFCWMNLARHSCRLYVVYIGYICKKPGLQGRQWKRVWAILALSHVEFLPHLRLLVKCLTASHGMLLWSFCLLSLVQCVAGMTLSTLCIDYMEEPWFNWSQCTSFCKGHVFSHLKPKLKLLKVKRSLIRCDRPSVCGLGCRFSAVCADMSNLWTERTCWKPKGYDLGVNQNQEAPRSLSL